MGQVSSVVGDDLVYGMVLVGAVVLVGVARLVVSRRRGTDVPAAYRRLLSVTTLAIVAAILVVTLSPTATGAFPTIRTFSWDLGRGNNNSWYSTINSINLVGNMLLFLPLGFVLTARFEKFRSLLSAAALLGFFAFGIELAQFSLNNGRAADVHDVGTNLLGGLVGWGLFRINERRLGRSLDRYLTSSRVTDSSRRL